MEHVGLSPRWAEPLLAAAEWLSLPGILAGAGGLVLWATWVVPPVGLDLGGGSAALVFAAALAAGWGAFVAPVFSFAGATIVVVVRLRAGPLAGARRTIELVVLGFLGIALAYTALPFLL